MPMGTMGTYDARMGAGMDGGDDEERKRRAQQAGMGAGGAGQAPAQAPGGTFRQMQQAGQARPPAPTQGGAFPRGMAPAVAPQSAAQRGAQDDLYSALTQGAPNAGGPPGGGPSSEDGLEGNASGGWRDGGFVGGAYGGWEQPFSPTDTVGADVPGGGITDAVEQSARDGLATPSRYDTQMFRTVRDAATADLNNDFARQAQALEERLASRGLSASSIAAQDFNALGGAQSRALGNLNAQLLREAATTQAQDRAQAQNAGLNVAQQRLAQTLGLGNLQLNRDQLRQQGDQFNRNLGFLGAQNDLNRRQQADIALGRIGGQDTLDRLQMNNLNQNQRLAIISNVLSNAQLDPEQIRSVLAAMGLGTSTSTSTSTGTGGSTGTGDPYGTRRRTVNVLGPGGAY